MTHVIKIVHPAGDETRAACSCGWVGPTCYSLYTKSAETFANEDAADHLIAVGC